MRRGWALAAVGLLAAGVRAGEGAATNAPPARAPLPAEWFQPYHAGEYRLAVGDVVEVFVFGHPDTVAKNVPIAPDGRLYYMFMEGLPAAGRTPDEVAREIEGRIKDLFASPSVSILPKVFSGNHFLVLGKVNKPGAYPLESALTLRQAIARANGLAQGIYRGTTTALASLRASYVLRGGARLPVDLEALLKDNDASQDIYVRPGDTIFIASGLGQEVYLMGAVVEQKAVAYTDGMTIVQLVSGGSDRAGGYLPDARLGRVLILRGALERPRTFEVDLQRILDGRAPDVYLTAGDLVYIPDKPYKLARELARQAVTVFVRSFMAASATRMVSEDIFPAPGGTAASGGGGNSGGGNETSTTILPVAAPAAAPAQP